MTSSEEQNALTTLADLLSRDLSKVDQEEIAEGIRLAELVARTSPDWSGRLIATLHRRGNSWTRIVEMTGVPQTTAWRRAEPYL